MNGPFLVHDRVRMFAAGVAGAGAMMVVLGAAGSPVAAEAIIWASRGDRREIYVGRPTVRAVIGNKIAPARHRSSIAATAAVVGVAGIAVLFARRG